jgi:DeoR family fructose operon transcriptional repressor
MDTENQSENQALFVEERKAKILLLLKENSKLLVPDLCKIFNVSPATIRNDLRDLAQENKLRRTHGGAIPIGKTSFEPTYADKELVFENEKKRIALCAADLVEDGDTIAIDSGSTTLEFAKCLVEKEKKRLTIVLNDIKIASCLEKIPDANIILLAGSLRHGYQCTVGPLALATLRGLNVDKAFMGTNALSSTKVFTTPDINQAEVKKCMIQIASETIMLCDSSKFNKVAFAEFATLEDIDKLITDTNLSPKMSAYLSDLQDSVKVFFV